MANEGRVIYNMLARDILERARQQAVGEAYKAITLAIDTLAIAVKNRKTSITKLYTTAAQEAAQAMKNAYEDRPYRTNFSGAEGAYRNDDTGNNRRYGGGLLGAALASPQMYRVSARGIEFINQDYLDSKARQWYRLNFGAGQRGSDTPAAPQTPLTIFGETLPGDYGLSNYQSSAAFRMPRGWWSSSFPASKAAAVPFNPGDRGLDAFIRRGSTKINPGKGLLGGPRMTLGIQGSRFLDVGVSHLIKNFPVVIETMISDWFAEASHGAGPGLKIKVKPSAQTINAANQFMASLRENHRV